MPKVEDTQRYYLHGIRSRLSSNYCKTVNVSVPFISRISRARQIRENNGHAKIR